MMMLVRERRRWLIAGLLFFISTIALLDRQTLSVLEKMSSFRRTRNTGPRFEAPYGRLRSGQCSESICALSPLAGHPSPGA